MRSGILTALLVIAALGAANAQMVAAHAPTAAAPKPAPAANTAKPAPGLAGQSAGKVVARVNGVELIERDLVREMYTIFPYAQQHNGFPKELEPDIRRGALQMIIFEELVYQEALRRKMTVPPARLAAAEAEFRGQFPTPAAYQQFLQTEVNGSKAAMRQKIRRSLLIDAFLNREVNGPARVTTAQAKAVYEKNLNRYRHGEILRIQSISIVPPNPTKAVLTEAQRRAQDAYKLAKAATTYRDFGLLAEKLSDDDFHVNMGDHKAKDAKDLPPPIVQAAGKMKVGEVSDLLQLGNNYTIFRLESRTPAGITPFAEVKADLQSDLRKEKTQQLRSKLGDQLRKNAKIEVL